MAFTPRTMARVAALAILFASLPVLAIRRQDPVGSKNGSNTNDTNCPSSNNTPNLAVLDGSQLNSCPGLSDPLGDRIVSLTVPNEFTLTITPALWANEFFSSNTILNVQLTNLTNPQSKTTLTLQSLVIGTALNNASYVLCDSTNELQNVNDVQGNNYCNLSSFSGNGGNEVPQPTPVTAADLTTTRWDFGGVTAPSGGTSTTLSLVVDGIPAEFVLDYGGGTCGVQGVILCNNLSLPPTGNTQFLAVVFDGTNTITAGNLELKQAPPAGNDLFSSPTQIASLPFTDFIDTTATNPQEILSGSNAGGMTDPQGDPGPTCSDYDSTSVFRSVWYTFTPANTNVVNISTYGSRYDTIVSAFTTTSPIQSYCNDDGIQNPYTVVSSDLSFTPLAAGQQFYIMVSEFPPDVDTSEGIAIPLSNDATLRLSISQDNPVPFIDSVQPVSSVPGRLLPQLTILGTGFTSGSLVNFNGTNLTPVPPFSANKIVLKNVEVPANQSTVPVTVINPNLAPRVSTSNVAYLPITYNDTLGFSNSETPLQNGAVFYSTVADFNNDGKLDVAFASAPNSGVVVLLGNGNGTFQMNICQAPEDNNSLSVGDFNGDGNLDVIVTYSNNGSIWLCLGNGDGTFQQSSEQVINGQPFFVATGDFNGDGILDLALLDLSTEMVRIALGNGDGTFQTPVSYPAGAALQFVIPGDFNGDGKLDLAVLNNGGLGNSNSVSILLGNGDGTFQAPRTTSTGVSPVYETAADFNGDGFLDLAVANQTDGSISVFLGNGDGTFKPRVDYQLGSDSLPSSVVAGDLNGDGNLDLLSAAGSGFELLFGNGQGSFQPAAPYAEPDQPYEAVLGDFNGDGRLDVIAGDDFGYDVFLQPVSMVSLSKTTLNFGTQAAATVSAPQSVTITNTGTATLSLAINGTADFTQKNTCGTSLLPGNNCQVSVMFAPTTVGGLNGAITITDNAPGSPHLVELFGTAVLPFTASPTSLSFGSVAVGSQSKPQTVTLTNNEPNAISFTFAASGDYSAVGSGSSPCGTSLESSQKCTISVTFSPTTSGKINGALTVKDSTVVKLQTVALSGTGTGGSTPPLTFSPSTLSFPNQAFATSSSPMQATIKNVGTKSVTISSIAASGNFTEAGSGTTPCNAGTQLAPGGTCSINVTFTPYYVGPLNGSITVSDNASVSLQVMDISGYGLLPVNFSPPDSIFPNQTVGTTSAPQQVTLNNNLSGSLTISNIVASGDFSVATNNCPLKPQTLAGNSQCTFTVTFTPGQVGTITGSVSVTDSALTSPQVFNLLGTGQ